MNNKSEKTKKKEAEKRRGYYSEIVSDVDHQQPTCKADDLPAAHKRTNLLWQIRTEKHAPIIQELPLPEKHVFLAPAQRWKTYDEEPSIVRAIIKITVNEHTFISFQSYGAYVWNL